LDAARSTVLRHPAWPGLIANLISWRASRLPGIADPNPRCGQPVSAVLPPGIREALLRAPDGTERHLRADAEGSLAIPGLPRPGCWELRVGPAIWPICAL